MKVVCCDEALFCAVEGLVVSNFAGQNQYYCMVGTSCAKALTRKMLCKRFDVEPSIFYLPCCISDVAQNRDCTKALFCQERCSSEKLCHEEEERKES